MRRSGPTEEAAEGDDGVDQRRDRADGVGSGEDGRNAGDADHHRREGEEIDAEDVVAEQKHEAGETSGIGRARVGGELLVVADPDASDEKPVAGKDREGVGAHDGDRRERRKASSGERS